jgi:hypothetical protein
MRNFSIVLLLSCFAFSSCTKELEPTPPTPEPATPTTLNQGLLLYLPFDGNLADSSGGGNNGTGFGSITYGNNRYFEPGKSVALNGTNSHIEIPGTKFDTLSNFTIYLEFIPYSTASMSLFSRALFAPTTTNTRQSFNLMINYGGGTRFQMKKPGNCDNTNTATAFGNDVLGYGLPSINGWNYVAITFNGSTIRSYLNGNLVGTDNQPGANFCSNAPLMIGSWWQGDPYYFNGRIDEVRVYNRALSTAEITQLFQLHK